MSVHDGPGARRGNAISPAPEETRRLALRLLLAFVAISAAFPGVWATFAPASFYASFPLGGGGWVAPLGPQSPHFIADVGAFYLAFAGMFAWAAWRPDRALVVPLVLAWTLFSVLHLVWHLRNLEPLDTADAVAQTVTLGLVLLLPLVVLGLLPVSGRAAGGSSGR